MLIQQSVRSGSVALQQEAIVAAASHTAVILSMNWDENNSQFEIGISPILDTQRVVIGGDPFAFGDGNLSGLIGIEGRVTKVSGTVYAPSMLFGKDETNETESNGTTFDTFDDVDDYHESNLGLTVFNSEYTVAAVGDYVDIDLNMYTEINYAEDRPEGDILNGSSIALGSRVNSTLAVGSGGTNIKFIRVNLTSNSGVDELNKNITFEAFSCNIGTSVPKGEVEL